MKEKVKNELDASILCDTTIGLIRLSEKNFELTKVLIIDAFCCKILIIFLFEKKIVEDTEAQVNQLEGVTSVHARYYELASNYYRMIGSHSDYYRNALRYLGCCDFEKMPSK